MMNNLKVLVFNLFACRDGLRIKEDADYVGAISGEPSNDFFFLLDNQMIGQCHLMD